MLFQLARLTFLLHSSPSFMTHPQLQLVLGCRWKGIRTYSTTLFLLGAWAQSAHPSSATSKKINPEHNVEDVKHGLLNTDWHKAVFA